MPYKEQTYDLEAEIERLESDLKDIAETVAGLEDGNRLKKEKNAEGQQLDVILKGVRWAYHTAHDDENVPVWDESVDTVTLSGLNGAEFAHVEDELIGKAMKHTDGSIGQGSHRLHNVAKGTVEAPYVDGKRSMGEKLEIIGQLPNAYLKWANTRINELTEAEGNEGPRYGDYLADARDKKT